MSMNKYVYVMIGIRLDMKSLPFDMWDDKYLPYIEGHEGIEIGFYYGEGSDYLYIGKLIAESEPYFDEVSKELNFLPHMAVALMISEAVGYYVSPDDVADWFFELWH